MTASWIGISFRSEIVSEPQNFVPSALTATLAIPGAPASRFAFAGLAKYVVPEIRSRTRSVPDGDSPSDRYWECVNWIAVPATSLTAAGKVGENTGSTGFG